MFVEMVQSQSLNFVLPSTWDDTKENHFLHKWMDSLTSEYHKFFAFLLENRMYAQSWTKLSESDAMWRIYSFDKKSLRIKIDTSEVERLNGIRVEPVIYSDEEIDYSNSGMNYMNIFCKLIAQKREAFRHEEEIRLIYLEGTEIERLPKTFDSVILAAKLRFNKATDSDLDKVPFEKFSDDMDYVNIFNQKKHHQVSFSTIPNFIKGVLVNPFASKWYVDTVKTYCELNNIPFEGKSELYKADEYIYRNSNGVK